MHEQKLLIHPITAIFAGVHLELGFVGLYECFYTHWIMLDLLFRISYCLTIIEIE